MSSVSISAIFLLYALLSTFAPTKSLTPNIFQWYLFAIYKAPNETIQVAIYRHFRHDLSCKFRYAHCNLNLRNTRSSKPIAGSISVSVKASQNALCSIFSFFPSNQDCKWGGVSIILPWVSAICGAHSLSLSRNLGKTHPRLIRRRGVDLYNG